MPTTVRLPLEIRNPQISVNPGAAHFNVAALTAWDAGYFVFDKTGNVDVVWFGLAFVPANMAVTPAAKIICYWAANSTAGSNIRTQIAAGLVKSADTTNHWNRAALTAETAITTTLSTTAWTQATVTYPASGSLTNQPAANDVYIVKITRLGSDTVNDTLTAATPLFLFGPFLQVDIT